MSDPRNDNNEQRPWIAELSAMVLMQPAPDDFLAVGLKLAGFGGPRQLSVKTKLRRFRGHYGASPETCSAVFSDLQTTTIVGSRIKPDLMGFFIAMNWLRSCKTEEEMSGAWNGINEKTGRGKWWKYVAAIRALKGSAKVSEQQTTSSTNISKLFLTFVLCLCRLFGATLMTALIFSLLVWMECISGSTSHAKNPVPSGSPTNTKRRASHMSLQSRSGTTS
jgi:hypothetical protein